MGEILKTIDVIIDGTKSKNHPDECPRAFELIKNIILNYKKSLSITVE